MEKLADPCGDRHVTTLVAPPHRPLDHSKLFPQHLKRGSQEVSDWKLLLQHLQAEGRINKNDVI